MGSPLCLSPEVVCVNLGSPGDPSVDRSLLWTDASHGRPPLSQFRSSPRDSQSLSPPGWPTHSSMHAPLSPKQTNHAERPSLR